MRINHFSTIFVIIILHRDFSIGKPNPSKSKEKNFSFAIPAFLLGGGGGIGGGNNVNAVNNGNLPNVNAITSTQSNQNTNLNNIASNLFQRLTITRTILTTVATITAPVFRTCTTQMAVFTACAGRKRRTVAGQDEDKHPESDTFQITLIVGPTTVTDQSVASMMLNLNNNDTNTIDTVSPPVGINTTENLIVVPKILDLEPSDDSFMSNLEDVDHLNDISTTLIVKQTPGLVKTGVNDLDVDADGVVHDHRHAHARINLRGTTTTTLYFPVTKVVNSTVTGVNNAMSQVLTISYAGCMPPTLPVTGTPCGP